jgi:hypothetical protein
MIRSIGLAILLVGGACDGGGRAGGGDDVDGGTGTDGGGGGGTPIGDVPAMLAAATCDIFIECAGAAFTELALGGDCLGDLTRVFANGDFAIYGAAITGGRMRYDGARVGECIAAIRALGCRFATERFPDVCEEVFDGVAAAGEPCSFDAECAGRAFCAGRETTCPGTCTAQGGEGAACLDDGECAPGLLCQQRDHVCGLPVAAGEPCGGTTARACDAGALCMGEMGDTPGRCVDLRSRMTAEAGASCNLMDGPWCVEGVSCAVPGPIGQSCRTEVASGADCNFGVPDMCPSGEYCPADPTAFRFSGSCTPLPAADAPCADVLFGRRCADHSTCDADTCRAVSENGGPCTVATTCYSGRCESGTCAPPPYCTG